MNFTMLPSMWILPRDCIRAPRIQSICKGNPPIILIPASPVRQSRLGRRPLYEPRYCSVWGIGGKSSPTREAGYLE